MLFELFWTSYSDLWNVRFSKVDNDFYTEMILFEYQV